MSEKEQILDIQAAKVVAMSDEEFLLDCKILHSKMLSAPVDPIAALVYLYLQSALVRFDKLRKGAEGKP